MVFNKKDIIRKVRIFILRIPRRKILTFSFFLFLATSFWLMQVYRQSFEVTATIPVKYKLTANDIVLREDLPTHMTLRLRDDGAALFRYYFTRRNDSLEIDIDKILQESTTKVLQGPALEQTIRRNMLNSTTLLNYSPVKISFQYDSLKSKKVPVIFDGQVNLAAGYLLNDDIKITPDSVMIYASENDINKIHYAYTETDTVNDFKSNKPLVFKLIKSRNQRVNPSEVLVEVPIEEFTQKSIQIPISCLNVDENIEVKFFPSTVKISFFVGLSKYRQITQNDFEIQYDYHELKKMKQSIVPVRLTLVPSYIQNLRIEPADVEFIFEQK